MPITVREQANGVAYTYTSDRIRTPVTLIFPFGTVPKLVFGDQLIRISQPERFGEWETPKQRKSYITQFAQFGE